MQKIILIDPFAATPILFKRKFVEIVGGAFCLGDSFYYYFHLELFEFCYSFIIFIKANLDSLTRLI